MREPMKCASHQAPADVIITYRFVVRRVAGRETAEQPLEVEEYGGSAAGDWEFCCQLIQGACTDGFGLCKRNCVR